ncbi:MAG: nucleotidyltransferase family protein [Pararhodobacter sp.]|nr:nucleotidyltransferase family protein [Pararhodobacter sp.]
MTVAESCKIANLLRQDALRWQALGLVEVLALPEGCIGAGFVRNLVWDHFHGRRSDCRDADIDVLYFDRTHAGADRDADLEAGLRARAPQFRWSVSNQARMHRRNGDAPYTSVEDAMRHWPETATAVAALRAGTACRILAPFGVDDLMGMILRPTSASPHKLHAFNARLDSKGWRCRWPDVRLACPPAPPSP